MNWFNILFLVFSLNIHLPQQKWQSLRGCCSGKTTQTSIRVKSQSLNPVQRLSKVGIETLCFKYSKFYLCYGVWSCACLVQNTYNILSPSCRGMSHRTCSGAPTQSNLPDACLLLGISWPQTSCEKYGLNRSLAVHKYPIKILCSFYTS